MAFEVKYRKKFQRIGVTATYRVEIWENNYAAAVIVPYKMGADPFHVKTLGAERDEEKIVIGSEIAFEFVLKKRDDESDYDALFESKYRDHIVKFYNDDTSPDPTDPPLWQGYLQPENMYKSVFESNLHIYLSASDALKDLADYEFLSDTDSIVTGRLSGLAIIKQCLKNLDQDSKFQHDFKVKLGTKPDGLGVGVTALEQVTHDCRRFSKVQNGKTVIDNCLMVIEKVLTPYSCQLFQWGGEYYIKNRHEAASSYYTYNWDLDSPPDKANSADVVNIDTLKFKRDAEQSLLAPVKEIGIKLLNRNTGGELEEDINIFGAGTPWDFSGVDMIDEDPLLHIILDETNEVGTRNIFLTAGTGTLNKVTANDYIKLRFKVRATNTQHSNIDSPKLVITVSKPGGGTASTWEEYIINSWRMYESPNNEVFFVTGDGNYNITIHFEQSTAAGVTYTEDVYLTDFSLTKIVAIEDATYSDITFDTYFKAVSDVGKKVKEPFDFYFGDSPGTGDLAALVYDGSNTDEWDRVTGGDDKSLLELYCLNHLTNRKAYSKYLILTVKDAADSITPVNYITFGGDTYDIVSFDKSYRFSWVTLHLKQRLTTDVTMTFNEVPLTSIDGEKMTNDSLIVTAGSSFPGAGIALSTGTAWGTSFAVELGVPIFPRLSIKSAAATSAYTYYTVGTTVFAYMGVAGAPDSLITGSVLGDTTIRSENKDILFSADGGTTAHLRLGRVGTLGSAFQANLSDGTRFLRFGVNATAAEIQSTGGVPLYFNYGGNNILMFGNSAARLLINGGLHVGGTSDPGDNNLLVDGNATAGAFKTTDFTIIQSGTDLLILYGATTIAKISSAGYLRMKDEIEPFASMA